MPGPEPDLSIIIVTHNGRDRALLTLRSARASVGDISTEWFVVDSGSFDGTPDEIERSWHDLAVLRLPNLGFAAASNTALTRARGRYVLLLNPDVEIVAGTLADLVIALDARPEVGAASVVQQTPDGRLLPSIRRFPSPGRQLGEALFSSRWPIAHRLQEPVTCARSYRQEHSADWLVGAFLIVRQEAIKDVGPLDERFFLYSEETDWCYRLRGSGWEVRHLPVMTVTHHRGDYERPELAAQLSYAKLLFAQKHFTPPRTLAIRSALVVGHMLRLVLIAATASLQPRLRIRARAERRALAVTLGISPPPFPPS